MNIGELDNFMKSVNESLRITAEESLKQGNINGIKRSIELLNKTGYTEAAKVVELLLEEVEKDY